MENFNMAICGIYIAFALRALINAVIYPIIGYPLAAILLNNNYLAFEIVFLAVFYKDECKAWYDYFFKGPDV